MQTKWLNVIKDILKYALGAVLGAVGVSVGGCAPTMWVI